MRFKDMEALVRLQLPEADVDIPIYPGPEEIAAPGRFIQLSNYGGPGVDAEDATDLMSWQVLCVGRQNDYTDAESLAFAIDTGFLNWHSAHIGESGPWLAGIQRVGGAPNSQRRDDADRWHFVCSYILRTELALTN